MGVSQKLEVLDLALDTSRHVHVEDLLAVDDLHGDLVARDRVYSDWRG